VQQTSLPIGRFDDKPTIATCVRKKASMDLINTNAVISFPAEIGNFCGFYCVGIALYSSHISWKQYSLIDGFS